MNLLEYFGRILDQGGAQKTVDTMERLASCYASVEGARGLAFFFGADATLELGTPAPFEELEAGARVLGEVTGPGLAGAMRLVQLPTGHKDPDGQVTFRLEVNPRPVLGVRGNVAIMEMDREG